MWAITRKWNPCVDMQPLLRLLLEYRLNPIDEERKFWPFTDCLCNSANDG